MYNLRIQSRSRKINAYIITLCHDDTETSVNCLLLSEADLYFMLYQTKLKI